MNESGEKRVSIIVPFLNEAQNLPILYERIVQSMAARPEAFEILFVDDGSTDHSPRWVTEKTKQDPRVKLLRLSRNFGHQIAITAGMDYAHGDAMVIIDADLQDPPEVIPELLAKWHEGYEVVYAVRESRAGETWLKKFLAAAFYQLFHHLAKVDVPVNAGDFRLVDRKIVEALKHVRELHRFMRGLTCWVGYSQCAVRYKRAARLAGNTHYPMWKSARLALDAVTSFSGTPLRWITGGGMIVSVFGTLLAVRIILQRILMPGQWAAGWTSLMSLMLILGGIQLICLGLIGQYVSRIFEETKKRPLYYIREEIGLAGRDDEQHN